MTDENVNMRKGGELLNVQFIRTIQLVFFSPPVIEDQ
jgi:hypothetical protein